MHDCRKFKDKLVDLLFESADSAERSRLFAEMNSCESCQSLYRSMSETLVVFDQVAQTALPEEAYWDGYERRLRARLTEQPRPQRSLFAPLFVKDLLARIPLPLRIAFACLVVAAGLWLLVNQIDKTDAPAPVIVYSGEPDSEQKKFAENNKQTQSPKRLSPKRQSLEHKPDQMTAQKPRRARTHAAREVKPDKTIEQASDGGASDRRSTSADRLNPEMASHVERAELLMRSFRNIKLSREQTVFDVAYEKQLSKELLARNRRLRRSAENRREFVIEDLLTSIEPLLLDIANLTDSPTETDVRSIKELIQSQEVVAALQFYSAKATSRNY